MATTCGHLSLKPGPGFYRFWFGLLAAGNMISRWLSKIQAGLSRWRPINFFYDRELIEKKGEEP